MACVDLRPAAARGSARVGAASARSRRESCGPGGLVEPFARAAEAPVAFWGPVGGPAALAPAGPRARHRALARDVGGAARQGARSLFALADAPPRAAPRAARPLAEIPGTAAERAGERAGEFSQVPAAAAGAAPDAARAVARCQPHPAPADDRARARATPESPGAAPAPGAARAPLIGPAEEVGGSLFRGVAVAAWPHRDGHVAHVQTSGRHLEPFFVPAAPRLGVGEKRRCVGPQHFQLRALRRRHLLANFQGLERRALLGVLVEAERPAAGRP